VATYLLGANPARVADHSHLRRRCCSVDRHRSPERCRRGGVEPAPDDRRHFGAPPSARERQHLAALYRAVADDAVAAGAGAPRRSADARSLSRDLSAARAFSLNLPTWPVEGTWWFNPIAWQLIFAIGIFAGRRLKGGGIAYDARLFSACLAIVVIGALVRTDAFGYASGLWQDVCNVLDCGKTDLGFARLVHFLALAYIVYHSGVTGLMRRTPAFLALCLIGRYGLPVFATGTVLSAMGELVETRSEALSHHLAFGAAIVVGGILIHYLVARGLAACRNPRQVGDGGVLVHIRVRSICAGIAALALGVSLESVGRHLVGATSAGLRAESALFSVFETIRPKSLDHRTSLVRVASLETGFAFESAVEESEPPAS